MGQISERPSIQSMGDVGRLRRLLKSVLPHRPRPSCPRVIVLVVCGI